MRTIPFKEVLYDIARKNSIDPESDNFLEKEAIAMGTFIDQWVRRTYPGADWPEWTRTYEFAPSNHIVSWDSVALDLVIAPSTAGTLVKIGRVFTVYLVDPRTTPYPVSTDHTLLDTGIHCGHEHGSSVWIKFMQPAPKFSAERWRPDETYQKDDVRYSSTTGECYRSKANGNLGHDPSTSFSPPPPQQQPVIQLPSEIIQQLTPSNPGLAAQDQIVDVVFPSGSGSLTDIPNPPPLNARFFVEVVSAAGALVGNATSMGNGTDTLDLIVTDLSNQLISALTGFTSVSVDTNTFTIRIQDDSNFRVNQAFWGAFSQPNRNVPVRQIQSYVAATLASQADQQVIEFPLTSDDVVPGAIYTLDFKDLSGVSHVVNYMALPDDQAQQILNGLIAQTQSAAGSDPFFGDVHSTLDTVSPAAHFGTTTAISMNADMMLPGSPWWELVLMPIDLADQIMRGTTADVLKEWGQMQAGGAEEQIVPAESKASSSKFATFQVPGLTTQQEAISRYKTGG